MVGYGLFSIRNNRPCAKHSNLEESVKSVKLVERESESGLDWCSIKPSQWSVDEISE